MPFIEPKRIAKSERSGRTLVARIREGTTALTWADIWRSTAHRDFSKARDKDGHVLVQVGFVLVDKSGRVGVIERAAKQVGAQRFTKGFTALGSCPLLSSDTCVHPHATFDQAYPVPLAALAQHGSVELHRLGAGYSCVTRMRDGLAASRTYIFVVYVAELTPNSSAALVASAPPVATNPDTDTFIGLMPIAQALQCIAPAVPASSAPASAASETPHMDLMVLSALRDVAARTQPADAAVARSGDGVFRTGAPIGVPQTRLDRWNEWKDTHRRAMWCYGIATSLIVTGVPTALVYYDLVVATPPQSSTAPSPAPPSLKPEGAPAGDSDQ